MDAAAIAVVEEVVIVEEELGADVVGPGGDFFGEVVHFPEAVGSGRMAFREACDADAEAPGVWVDSGLVELADEADEVGGVAEIAVGPVVVRPVARGVTAEGEDVRDAGLGVAGEDFPDFVLVVADAGEVGDRWCGGGGLDANDEIVGELAGAAAGAIGDGDERWLIGLEFNDGAVEVFGAGSGAWREELEGEGGLAVSQNIENVHGKTSGKCFGLRREGSKKPWKSQLPVGGCVEFSSLV